MTTNHKNFVSWLPTIGVAIAITLAVLVVPETTHAEKLYEVLKGPISTDPDVIAKSPSTTIKTVWDAILDLINYAGIGLLIFIAFANILRLNINTYGIKKFLPTLILAIVAANFSYLICRIIIDLSNIVMSALIIGPTGASGDGSAIGSSQIGIAKVFKSPLIQNTMDAMVDEGSGKFYSAAFWKLLVLIIFEFIGAILMFILAFLFFIRNYVIYFLVALSPLAFISTVLPQTKSLFNQWWQNFMKWAFLPVVSIFWLWLGSKFISTINDYTGFLAIVFAMACYYMAITSPFKLGGGIMSTWQGVGKKVWGATGGKATGFAKQRVGERYEREKGRIANRFRDTKPGKWYLDREASRQLSNEAPGLVKEKQYKDARINEIYKRVATGKGGPEIGRYKAQLRQDAGAEARENPQIHDASISEVKDMLEIYKDDKRGGRIALPGDDPNDRINKEWTDDDTGGRKLMALLARVKQLQRSPVHEERKLANDLETEITDNPYWIKNKKGMPIQLSQIDQAGFQSSSAVGEGVDNIPVDSSTAVNIIGEDRVKAIRAVAINGSGNFEESIKSAGVDVSGLSDEERQSIQEMHDSIRSNRSSLVQEENDAAINQLDQEMSNFRIVKQHLTEDTTTNLEGLSKQLEKGASQIDSDLHSASEAAKGIAPGISAKLNLMKGDGEKKDFLKGFYSNLQHTVEGFATTQPKPISSLKGDMPAYAKQWEDMEREYLASRKASMQNQVKNSVTSRLILDGQAENIPSGISVGDARTQPNAQGTQFIQGVANQIADSNQGIIEAIQNLPAGSQATAKDNVSKELSDAVGQSIREAMPATSIDSRITSQDTERALRKVFGDKKAMSGLSQAIGKETGKIADKIKIPIPNRTDGISPPVHTSTTNTAAATPSPPRPIGSNPNNIGGPKP